MEFSVRTADDRKALADYILSLPNKAFEVSVKLHREKRTSSQNRWYWEIVGIVARETDNDKDVVHKTLARKFLGYDVHTLGDERIAVVRSTSTLNTEQFSEYLSKVEAFVAQ